ncbi:hypothetical protein ABW20_dc0100888 [Dactylellina cionopaga]|nr:hypothetical protein ABW20_dc0100888 [Dactylellina cionopaga]
MTNPNAVNDIYKLYWNQGAIYFHESFHWKNTVGNPQIIDIKGGYGPKGVEKLAKMNNENSTINADSYTIAGTAACK